MLPVKATVLVRFLSVMVLIVLSKLFKNWAPGCCDLDHFADMVFLVAWDPRYFCAHLSHLRTLLLPV